MTFVWVHVVWFGIWILINSIPRLPHIDPFPFTFLTLVVFSRSDLFINIHPHQSESRYQD
jgi:uncharacterized membrane protein